MAICLAGILIIILITGLAACEDTNLTTPMIPMVTTTSGESSLNPTEIVTPAASPSTDNGTSGTDLTALLAKSDNITMKYEMVATTNTTSTSTQINSIFMQKGHKIRFESTVSDMQFVTLIDNEAETAIVYIPAQKMAFKTTLAQANLALAETDWQVVSQDNPVEAGTEILDGKQCIIIEYDSAQSGATRMWVWEEKGVPLKIEQDTAAGKTVINFINYEFTDIDDSEFVLPEGISATDMGNVNIPALP